MLIRALATALILVSALSSTLVAQTELSASSPEVQALAADPDLALRLVEGGAVEFILDSEDPGGYVVAVYCDELGEQLAQLQAERAEARARLLAADTSLIELGFDPREGIRVADFHPQSWVELQNEWDEAMQDSVNLFHQIEIVSDLQEAAC